MAGARDLVDRLHASEGSRLMRVFRASLRSPQDAADATQETFLRLLGGPRLDAIANSQSYLFAVTRSVAIAIDRRAARYRALFAAPADPEIAAPLSAGLYPEPAAWAPEWRDRGVVEHLVQHGRKVLIFSQD